MKRWRILDLSGLVLFLIIGLSGCGGSSDSSSTSSEGRNMEAAILSTEAAPTSWIKCADEWGICALSGTTQVRYGLNGTYVTRTASGSVGCNNNVFGDPLPGADKICEYATLTPVPDPDPPPSSTIWTKCANEWSTCNFTGTALVRYGLNGTYVTMAATGSIACNNNVFGDPLPGVDKICEYQTSSSDPTPDPDPPPPNGLPAPVPASTPMTMSCVDGTAYQCSGRALIRVENGVALTSSGVHAYGKSTSDTAPVIADPTSASGLAPASGGHAEFRVSKSNSGIVSKPVIVLDRIGISWDDKTERPTTVESFRTTQGRDTLSSSGVFTFAPLPASSNLTFYDYATKGMAGTQLNYANNHYFPRNGNPSRCPAGSSPCPTVETSGIHQVTGDWKSGGIVPHLTSASRLHGDGDVHAGNAVGGGYLPGGNGIGVPFPGSKGYRYIDNWNYQYSNLGSWLTYDTVKIVEWTGGRGIDEHNQNRRGMISYGAVTAPAVVPSSGSATYSGIVHGWYARDAQQEPFYFRGTVSITVNFATRRVMVTVQNTVSDDGSATSLPLAFNADTAMGASGTNVANYLTGPVSVGIMSGGIGGRYFGPVRATGSGGTGPAEIGGAFTLYSSASGATAIGGFIARKQ